jgi:protein-tyrosine phosphatase
MSEIGYVDIHSHVLYGLDDGAKTREQSVQMLELAFQTGTTDIVATPHANGQYQFKPMAIAEQVADLSCGTALRIHRGCDFHLQFDNIEDALADPNKYTINHKRYLLVEFPDLGIFSESDTILRTLLDGGMAPIITHPERNRALQRKLDDIARWVKLGCYVQATAGSYLGRFGKAAKQCADELIRHGLVHFVASDAHDVRFRPPNLNDAYALLAGRWGEESIRPLFVENPRAVLTGGPVAFRPRPRQIRQRSWFSFWQGWTTLSGRARNHRS